MKIKKKYSVLMVILLLLNVIIPVSVYTTSESYAEDVEPGTLGNKIIIRKYEKGDYTKLLEGAQLTLFKVEGDSESLVEGGEFTSDGIGKEFNLADGVYKLKEKEAPDGYTKAEEIVFNVGQGKVTINGNEVSKESQKPFSYEAFNDMDAENDLGGENYGKEYYMKYNGSNEVVYCFNVNLGQPADSYNNGAEISYEEALGNINVERQLAGLPRLENFKYTKMNSKSDLKEYAPGAVEADSNVFRNKIKRVIFAGYPNELAGITFTSATDTGKRAATQLAIYHFTDGAPLDGSFEHGFNGYGEDVINDAKKIVEFANGTETPAALEGFDFNFYVPNVNKFQNLIGTKYHPEDLVYLIKMEDEKAPLAREIQFSKVDVGGTEIADAQIQIKDGDNNVVESWKSEAGKTKTVKLVEGVYTFHEEVAPKGYLKVSDFEFTVKKDGSIEIGKIVDGDKVEYKGGKIVVTDNAESEDPGNLNEDNPQNPGDSNQGNSGNNNSSKHDDNLVKSANKNISKTKITPKTDDNLRIDIYAGMLVFVGGFLIVACVRQVRKIN